MGSQNKVGSRVKNRGGALGAARRRLRPAKPGRPAPRLANASCAAQRPTAAGWRGLAQRKKSLCRAAPRFRPGPPERGDLVFGLAVPIILTPLGTVCRDQNVSIGEEIVCSAWEHMFWEGRGLSVFYY